MIKCIEEIVLIDATVLDDLFSGIIWPITVQVGEQNSGYLFWLKRKKIGDIWDERRKLHHCDYSVRYRIPDRTCRHLEVCHFSPNMTSAAIFANPNTIELFVRPAVCFAI